MGLRGELFSAKVLLQNRTYFFNVKENRMGDLYLNIVESKNRDEGGFDRQSVILFADDLQEFLKGFDEALRVLEKEVRERRHQARSAEPVRSTERARPAGRVRDQEHDRDSNRESTRNSRTDDKTGGGKRERRDKYSGTDNKKTGHSERPHKGSPSPKGKRIVVKKK